MNANSTFSLTPRELVRLLTAECKWWIVPAVACGLLAAAYSLVMPRYWDASQALVVRQETAGSQGATPGKFADLYEMRTMQETILELAKSREVVVATLKAVDQRLRGVAQEPDDQAVEAFRKRLKMLPPDGGEFGKSEVFYFTMKDPSRERAIELVGELCRQLESGLRELRAARAQGLTAELTEQVALAAELHAQETKRLVEFESEVGSDLGELRMLHSGSSGQSDLRQEVVQLEADVRKYQAQVRESEQLLTMLRAAENDPTQLVATPNSLLTSQPALRRLKEGLVDSQLATAKLGGKRSADHPLVLAAVEAENRVRRDLHRELVTAIRGAEAEIQLGRNRVAATEALLQGLESRLGKLAERRGEYSNRVAAVDNSRITLDRARQNLSTAKAALAAAKSGSLVTRIDQPETGPYPAGPGRTVITLAGVVGGMMLGLALVFLKTAPASPPAIHSGRERRGVSNHRDRDVASAEGLTSQPNPPPLVAERTTPPAPVEELWPGPSKQPGVVIHPAPNSQPASTVSEATGTTLFAKPSEPVALLPASVTAPVQEASTAKAEPVAELIKPAEVLEAAESVHSNDATEDSWADTWAPEAAWSRAEAVARAVESSASDSVVSAAAEWPVHEEPQAAPEFQSATAAAEFAGNEETRQAAFRQADDEVAADEAEEAEEVTVEQYFETADAIAASSKRVLPTSAGTLPSAGGALPSLAAAPYGGMSLQEALQAARQSFAPEVRG
jgi:uncharacterized protein involved in exopolysaccharide biosynthesis